MVLLVAAVPASVGAQTTGSRPLPTFEVVVEPNTTEPDSEPGSRPSAYNFMWNQGTSAATPLVGPNGRDHGRVIRVGGPGGQDEWWFAFEWYFDESFPAYHGDWGRFVDFHNVPGDVGWGWGSPVSAVALDWDSNARPRLTLEHQHGRAEHVALPFVRGRWQSVLMHVVFGRTDGTTARPGSVQIWMDGRSRAVADVRRVNTLQRAVNPATGEAQTQQWVELWEGFYTRNTPVRVRVRHTLARVGTTLQQALDDRPTLAASWGSVARDAGGADSSSTRVASRSTGDFLAPASLLVPAVPAATRPAKPAKPRSPTWPAVPASGWRSARQAGVQTGEACEGCRVRWLANGTLGAAIEGGGTRVETAYTRLGLGGDHSCVAVTDRIRLTEGQRLNGNLAVLQMRDRTGQLVYELYVAGSDRTLRLWSPAGGLRRGEVAASTGVVVPNTRGAWITVELAAQPGRSITVAVAGKRRISLRGLRGASTRGQRLVRLGIDHYDSPADADPVEVFHRAFGYLPCTTGTTLR